MTNKELNDDIAELRVEIAIVKTKLDVVTRQLESLISNIKWIVAGILFPPFISIGTAALALFTKGANK